MTISQDLRAIRAFVNYAAMGVVPSTERAEDVQSMLSTRAGDDSFSQVSAICASIRSGLQPSLELCQAAQHQVRVMWSSMDSSDTDEQPQPTS